MNYLKMIKTGRKCIFVLLSFLIIPTVLLAQSPGSFREKEKHGFGFSFVAGAGTGAEVFYDYAINSTFQLHLFGGGTTQSESSLFGNNTIDTSTNLAGLSLRMFPSQEFGFFIGLGGGGYSATQTIEQNIYCYSILVSANPSECSGFEGTTISKTTESKLSGTAAFGEVGWQGYDGFYFTIGSRGGSVGISEETDNTDEVIDTSNHKEKAVEHWEAAKTLSQVYISFGWHF